jgi:hypothetical protein
MGSGSGQTREGRQARNLPPDFFWKNRVRRKNEKEIYQILSPKIKII